MTEHAAIRLTAFDGSTPMTGNITVVPVDAAGRVIREVRDRNRHLIMSGSVRGEADATGTARVELIPTDGDTVPTGFQWRATIGIQGGASLQATFALPAGSTSEAEPMWLGSVL